MTEQALLCGPFLRRGEENMSKTNIKIIGLALGVFVAARVLEGLLPTPLDAYLGGE